MKTKVSFRNVPKLTTTIKYLEAAARLLDESPKVRRDQAILMLAQAGLSTRAIAEILEDYQISISQVHVARIIRQSAPELPL